MELNRGDDEEKEKEQSTAAKAKQVTVLRALHRMWNLIETDRWIVFVAFGSLIIAAVSSNPNSYCSLYLIY